MHDDIGNMSVSVSHLKSFCSYQQETAEEHLIIGTIDDYAKDGEPGVLWLLCSFYHEPLRTLIVKEV